MCHQWWSWKDEKGPTVGQLSEAEDVSSVHCYFICITNRDCFPPVPACNYLCACLFVVFFKSEGVHGHYMINILYSLKWRNCSKTPKANKTKKLSPPPNQNQTTLFYIYGVSHLKVFGEIKNIYTNWAALFILFDSSVASRLETSSVLK